MRVPERHGGARTPKKLRRPGARKSVRLAYCSIEKNPGARKGYLVLDVSSGRLVSWARLKKDAATVAASYDADPAAYARGRVAEGLEMSG